MVRAPEREVGEFYFFLLGRGHCFQSFYELECDAVCEWDLKITSDP